MAESKNPTRTRRGGIVSQAQANAIINWAAWPFILLALALLVAMLTKTRDWNLVSTLENAIPPILIAAPSLVLLWRKGAFAASIQLVIGCLFTAFHFSMTIAAARIGQVGPLVEALAVDLLWIVLTLQTWRAVAATRALSRLKSAETFA